jgi:signal transduction histidine kinase
MAQNLLQCEVLGDDPMDAVSASSQDGICGIARSSTVKTFEKALSTVANEVSLSKAIRIVVGGRPKELDSYVEEEICLIAKEALRNVLQHAEATSVEAEIEYLPSKFRVIVRDNGRGISPKAVAGKPHKGFVAMREGAGRIGGELRVWSKRGVGTEVELCVPDNTTGACRAGSL